MNRPTLLEYLASRVGEVWTEADANYVLHHVAEVERTALAVLSEVDKRA
jgi:hypothetical protein